MTALIAAGSVTLTWQTNVPADSQVEYGTTAAYRERIPPSALLNTAHSVPLASLTPGTTYHFRVESQDAAHNLAVSEDMTFLSPSGSQSGTSVVGDLIDVRVYPNPWRVDRHSVDVTFDNVSAGASVKIFTINGRLVRELKAAGTKATWNRLNESGERVSSGLYLYTVTDSQGRKMRGKLAIVR